MSATENARKFKIKLTMTANEVKNTYSNDEIVTINIDDTVPEGVNPITYLRNRIKSELKLKFYDIERKLDKELTPEKAVEVDDAAEI